MSSLDALKGTNRLLVFLFLLFAGLYYAQPFLLPVSLAVLLAMLMTGMANRLERWRMPRWLSSMLCTLLLSGIFAGSVYFVSDEVAEFAKDLPSLKERALTNLGKTQEFIKNKGISHERQESLLRSRSASMMNSVSGILESILEMIADVIRYFVLITVYIFLMLLYRDKFYVFVLRIVPDNKQEHAREVVEKSSQVAAQYLVGKLLMVVALFILYAVGFRLIGMEHALFMAMIGAVLSIIPIVGTLLGGLIPVALAFVTGNPGTALGAVAVFIVAQIIETYVLTPVIVGGKVNLNPLFTIMAVILGGALWGMIGMIVFIPFLGILKIICDNIPSLAPLGQLVGKEPKQRRSLINKLRPG